VPPSEPPPELDPEPDEEPELDPEPDEEPELEPLLPELEPELEPEPDEEPELEPLPPELDPPPPLELLPHARWPVAMAIAAIARSDVTVRMVRASLVRERRSLSLFRERHSGLLRASAAKVHDPCPLDQLR